MIWPWFVPDTRACAVVGVHLFTLPALAEKLRRLSRQVTRRWLEAVWILLQLAVSNHPEWKQPRFHQLWLQVQFTTIRVGTWRAWLMDPLCQRRGVQIRLIDYIIKLGTWLMRAWWAGGPASGPHGGIEPSTRRPLPSFWECGILSWRADSWLAIGKHRFRDWGSSKHMANRYKRKVVRFLVSGTSPPSMFHRWSRFIPRVRDRCTVHTVLAENLCECMYLFRAHIFRESVWWSRLTRVV